MKSCPVCATQYPDDATKNSLCQTVPFPDGVEGYPASVAVSMMNQFKWSQDKALRQWVRSSRLPSRSKPASSAVRETKCHLGINSRIQAAQAMAFPPLRNLSTLPCLIAEARLQLCSHVNLRTIETLDTRSRPDLE